MYVIGACEGTLPGIIAVHVSWNKLKMRERQNLLLILAGLASYVDTEIGSITGP
jgi:hypothetical protein